MFALCLGQIQSGESSWMQKERLQDVRKGVSQRTQISHKIPLVRKYLMLALSCDYLLVPQTMCL